MQSLYPEGTAEHATVDAEECQYARGIWHGLVDAHYVYVALASSRGFRISLGLYCVRACGGGDIVGDGAGRGSGEDDIAGWLLNAGLVSRNRM